MLANLAWVTQDKGTATALPRAVMQAAANLWEALADAETLSDPAALERAVTRSGVFLESSLASGNRATITAAAATDLKALMLSLRQVLREHGARPAASRTDASPHTPVPTARGPLTSLPATPATFALADAPADQMNELARQTDGALARLTTVQVANSSQDVPVQSMLVELPVRHENRASMLRLRIERDGSRAHEDTAESWTVEAAVDLGVIGALHARVTLTGQRIGVQLRAESAAVVDALSARAPELEAMLREAGLEVERVACLHGMPAGDAGRSPTRLLDVRA